jgi:hypothetical protein
MSKGVIMAGWDDVPHLSEEAKAEMLESTPPHLIDSRSKGVPGMGSGAIYPYPENEIKFAPFEIPPWYRRVYGMDVGWNFTAVLFGAHDVDNDTVYIYDGFKRQKAEPEVTAAAIRKRYPGGQRIVGVVDPASRTSGQADGKQLLKLYIRDEKLALRTAENAREAGIEAVRSRLATGRLKIASHLSDFFDEYRLYRRDEIGRVIKEHDHYMDALRYLIVSGLKLARPITENKVTNVHGRSYF